MNRYIYIIAIILCALAAGMAACSRVESMDHTGAAGSEADQKMFVCSMHPQVLQDEPGDCPICGMALIEKVALDGNSADYTLNGVVLPVNESVLAAVATVGVTEETLPVTIEAAGIISYDTRKVTTVSAHFRGLIEKSYVKYKFQPISKGQKIYDIYCPEIYATHMNYVNLLRKLPDNPDVTYDAREWLKNIGLTEDQITELIKGDKINYHLSVYSPAAGYAVGTDFDPGADFTVDGDPAGNQGSSAAGSDFGIGLNEGAIVEEGQPLFKVMDLGSVRADLKVRTEDAGLLKEGQEIILTDAVTPDRTVNARINQIEPLNGGLFQVVRAYIPDAGKHLYPGMKVQARIHAGDRTSWWIPKRAVADLGRHRVVFVMRDSAFIATEVETGMTSGDKIEIYNGLDSDSKIASNASLLTDSDGFIKTGQTWNE